MGKIEVITPSTLVKVGVTKAKKYIRCSRFNVHLSMGLAADMGVSVGDCFAFLKEDEDLFVFKTQGNDCFKLSGKSNDLYTASRALSHRILSHYNADAPIENKTLSSFSFEVTKVSTSYKVVGVSDYWRIVPPKKLESKRDGNDRPTA